jgi:hypothetical protein
LETLKINEQSVTNFDRDGIHLSRIGTKQYYRSLRLAILHASEELEYIILIACLVLPLG